MSQSTIAGKSSLVQKISNYRWTICALLFFTTTINYLDRQVLSWIWKDYLVPEFHWTDSDYGTITSSFSIFYAICMLFAGRFVDWMDTKKGFLWAIGIGYILANCPGSLILCLQEERR